MNCRLEISEEIMSLLNFRFAYTTKDLNGLANPWISYSNRVKKILKLLLS